MTKEQKYRIFITGGHATPAIACINELQSRGYNNLIYIGQKHTILFDKNVSPEYKMVKEQMNLPFVSLIAGKLSLFFNVSSFLWLLRLPVGFIHALLIQLRYRPRLILTFGSHIGLPVVFWGWVFNTPIIAHEQTVTLGRANKIIQKFATKICYSWQPVMDNIEDKDRDDDVKARVENPKFIYTGNPIRKQIFEVKTKEFNFSDSTKKILFITAGNQGSHALNEFFFENLELVTQKYNVIHQTGSNSLFNDFGRAKELAEKLNTNGTVYSPMAYIFVEQMAEAYDKCFAVVARAGANTITELLALKRKSILVPIPTTSGNEQFLNAELLRKLGLAIVIQQSDLDHMDIMKILEEAENLKIKDKDMVNLISSIHRDAEKRIVEIVEKTLKKIED